MFLKRCRLLPMILLIQVASCQRYADRIPLQAESQPTYDAYEDTDYVTENYDFMEDSDVYRWNVKDYPHPVNMPMYCHRDVASYVCDPDLVLTKVQADDLDNMINKIFEETPCICEKCQPNDGGIRLGIALMKNMFQPYNEHPTVIVQTFAEFLRTKWELGNCNNDILIVLATEDRMFYTDVGSQALHYVSFDQAYAIFDENKAHFSQRRFYEGLKSMLEKYHERTRSITRSQPSTKDAQVSIIIGSVIGGLALIAIVVIIVVLYIKKCKSPNDEKTIDEVDDKAEGDRSSWRRKDIKVLFGSLLTSDKRAASEYDPCKTTDDTKKENDDRHPEIIDDEVIDTTLQVCAEVSNNYVDASPPLQEVTTQVDVDNPEVKEVDDSGMTESDAFIKSPKLSSFASTSDYRGPVTNF